MGLSACIKKHPCFTQIFSFVEIKERVPSEGLYNNNEVCEQENVAEEVGLKVEIIFLTIIW